MSNALMETHTHTAWQVCMHPAWAHCDSMGRDGCMMHAETDLAVVQFLEQVLLQQDGGVLDAHNDVPQDHPP